MKELSYTFQDAVLIDYEQVTINCFSLTVQLYKVYYPLQNTLKLTFSGVFNQETMDKFITGLQKIKAEKSIIGLRVNTIQYDIKKVSVIDNLFFYIDIDYCKPERIHCKKIKTEKLEPIGFDEMLKQKESFWGIFETNCFAGCCGLSAFYFSQYNTNIALRDFSKQSLLDYLNDLINLTYLIDQYTITSSFFNENIDKEKCIQLFKNLIGMIKSSEK